MGKMMELKDLGRHGLTTNWDNLQLNQKLKIDYGQLPITDKYLLKLEIGGLIDRVRQLDAEVLIISFPLSADIEIIELVSKKV